MHLLKRSRAREVALQLLYQRESNHNSERSQIETFVNTRLHDKELRLFSLHLYDGVITHLSSIDVQLTNAADNWRLHRMACIDRNVLRLGVFELTYDAKETPRAVAIDEAIELARRFGSADSPFFINGVLDRVNKPMDAPVEVAAPADPETAP